MNKVKTILRCVIFVSALFPFAAFAQVTGADEMIQKTVISSSDTTRLNFIYDQTIHNEGWDALAQVKFWKQVINISSDTCLVNVASSRTLLHKVCRMDWSELSEEEKRICKDSINCFYNLDDSATIFVTSGKEEFYELKKVLPDISRAIKVFEQNNTDPWFAQTILLIESPGKTKAKSYVGANGPFQLMSSVARKYGLVVNRHHDDRTNIDKSAKAAAALLRTVCIPNVKKFLTALNLDYCENDLWFRLLVLHAYHAGAGNVQCALSKIQPQTGGTELFKVLWQTECGTFKNESQNYSQIALAMLSNFNELINHDGETIYLVQGDKMFKNYKRTSLKPLEAYSYLSSCLSNYESDLTDGTVSFEYFLKRVSQIRKELKLIAEYITGNEKDILINPYPAQEEQILNLAYRLMKRQRFEEAITLIKMDVEAKPNSANAYELLTRAYIGAGNKQLASIYANRSMAQREKNENANKD